MTDIQCYRVCSYCSLSKIYKTIVMYLKEPLIVLSILVIICFYCFNSIGRQDTIHKQGALEALSTLKELKESIEDTYHKERKQRSVLDKVRAITNCSDRPMMSKTQQRGEYWVLYNYIGAERSHRCHETITYTTHGDYSFLENLVPLLERWKGPISIAIHAPGTDFNETLASIAYLRECSIPEVKELVTFHIYFHQEHVPRRIPTNNTLEGFYDCSAAPPYLNVSEEETYKTKNQILYPVNVGRNIARESAQTHFILASDIELYPSANIIPKFLSMISENKGPLLSEHPRVFPLRVFEVTSTSNIPETKDVLLTMLRNKIAVPFHQSICPKCHKIPMEKEWDLKNETEDGQLQVFHVGKRIGKYSDWEPIFIGTHADPLYDERLSWEGKSDKMSQGYALCVLDYDFMILDSVFLVHKPGIKVFKRDKKRDALVGTTKKILKPKILKEMKILYGIKKGCTL